MRWFQLGKLEAQSVTNLRQHVDSAVLKELWAAVKPRGMKTWLSHEVIAKELFNVGYTSATGAWDAWKSECINPPRDHALAPSWHMVTVLGFLTCSWGKIGLLLMKLRYACAYSAWKLIGIEP